MRKHLRRLFDPDGKSRPGRNHWDARKKWFPEVKTFLSEDLKLRGFSNKNVWAATLFISYSLGPSLQYEAHEAIVENLGDKGILIYKTVIDQNTEKTRHLFLVDDFIKKLWPILRKVPRELCFKNNDMVDKLRSTYCEMTRIVQGKYKLKMPSWWASEFPAPEN